MLNIFKKSKDIKYPPRPIDELKELDRKHNEFFETAMAQIQKNLDTIKICVQEIKEIEKAMKPSNGNGRG